MDNAAVALFALVMFSTMCFSWGLLKKSMLGLFRRRIASLVGQWDSHHASIMGEGENATYVRVRKLLVGMSDRAEDFTLVGFMYFMANFDEELFSRRKEEVAVELSRCCAKTVEMRERILRMASDSLLEYSFSTSIVGFPLVVIATLFGRIYRTRIVQKTFLPKLARALRKMFTLNRENLSSAVCGGLMA